MRPSDVGFQVTGRLQNHDRAKGRREVMEEAAQCDSGPLHWQAAG